MSITCILFYFHARIAAQEQYMQHRKQLEALEKYLYVCASLNRLHMHTPLQNKHDSIKKKIT